MVRGLTEGSIVVSFEITHDKPRHNIVCASNNRDLASQYCFSVDRNRYGAHAHNDGEVITTATVETPTVGAGRITAVLTVSDELGGTCIITSEDVDALHCEPGTTGFFDQVEGLNRLIIGGNDNNKPGFTNRTHGRIYKVEIYDEPLTFDEAETIASGLVFQYYGGSTGTIFDGYQAEPQSQEDINKIKNLKEGTIIVSFYTDRVRLGSLICASDSGDPSSEFCFYIDTRGYYGVTGRESGRNIASVKSNHSAPDAGRVTAVLSVSPEDGTFLLSSQDVSSPIVDSSATAFFGHVHELDSLIIGGNRDRYGPQWEFDGGIYSVEVLEYPLTIQEARTKINKNLPAQLKGTLSYSHIGERKFQFHFEPSEPSENQLLFYDWEFPGVVDGVAGSRNNNLGMRSIEPSPTWEAPTGASDPFQGNVPAKIVVSVTAIHISETNYGYVHRLTKEVHVEPEGQAGLSLPVFRTWAFRNGENGYTCFRLPVVLRAGNGDLLIFAEGRKETCSDFHPSMHIVMKRSIDNGVTWGPLQFVADNVLPDGRRSAAQNPTAVLDRFDPEYPNGKLVLHYTANEGDIWDNMRGYGIRRTMSAWSGDHGYTWNYDKIESPAGTHDGDITNQVSHPNDPDYTAIYDADYAQANYSDDPSWAFSHPTTGHSIQLNRGPDNVRGRLLMTGTYSVRNPSAGFNSFNFGNYVYWSDDHGKSWTIGNRIDSPDYHLNETIAVELEEGGLLVNARSYKGDQDSNIRFGDRSGRVLVRGSFDEDGEVTFGKPWRAAELGNLDTAAGMARVTTSDQQVFRGLNRIAYTGPNDLPQSLLPSKLKGKSAESRNGCNRRGCLNFWMSQDEGISWNSYGPVPKLLHVGSAAYSDIVALPDTRVGVVQEGRYRGPGGVARERGLLLHSASLHWLSDGRDQRAFFRHDASRTEFDGSASTELTSNDVETVKDLAEGSMVVSFRTAQTDIDQTLFSVSSSEESDSWWSLTPNSRWLVRCPRCE